jgi:hypothetical protein
MPILAPQSPPGRFRSHSKEIALEPTRAYTQTRGAGVSNQNIALASGFPRGIHARLMLWWNARQRLGVIAAQHGSHEAYLSRICTEV